MDKESARKKLLEPLTDEQASRQVNLVTPEQITAALRAADRELDSWFIRFRRIRTRS